MTLSVQKIELKWDVTLHSLAQILLVGISLLTSPLAYCGLWGRHYSRCGPTLYLWSLRVRLGTLTSLVLLVLECNRFWCHFLHRGRWWWCHLICMKEANISIMNIGRQKLDLKKTLDQLKDRSKLVKRDQNAVLPPKYLVMYLSTPLQVR